MIFAIRIHLIGKQFFNQENGKRGSGYTTSIHFSHDLDEDH